MLRQTFAVVLLATSAVALAADDQAPTLSERSYAQARAVLDRAVEANGGAEALRAIKVVRLDLEGDTFPRLQMTTPEPPFEGGRLQETLLVDLEQNRMRLDQKTSGFGFDGDATFTIAGGQGANYDHRAKTATAIPAAQASQQQFIQYYRRLPSLLLRQALDRTTSLRYLGEDNFQGRRHEVVTFVMPDAVQVGVFVDAATNLVSKYELMFVDPFTGDEAAEIHYGAYKKIGPYQVPGTFTQILAGDAASKLAMRAEINPAITDDSFKVAVPGYKEVAAAPLTLEQRVETLAPGVHVMHNIAGQNQNTLIVEFADHIVAVEAPGSSDGSDAVIKRVKELIPSKPIRFIAMTHHHGDHIGGLRSYIAEGATVVTTSGNRGVVERTAAAPQNDRLRKNPRAVQILPIEKGKRVFSDATRTLELIDIGPNPHAREMVIAWLPAERVVFQGDLFFVPPNDAPFGPPQPTTVAFAKKLKKLGLPVARIASVHGATATIEQFNQATVGAR
jgi:glyoxylase-like metal-dependent hydrolase (beta-lactamase superfamily II)